MTMATGGEPAPFDWAALVPRVIHPVRVSIIEALHWIDQPLSASDLKKVFENEYELSFLSYHVVELAKWKAIRMKRKREVRGATEKFYFFR
jgi:hypothetical protein